MRPEEREHAGWGGAGSTEPEPLYSIGAVASMVGVPPATLRSWEERYRMVTPYRTPAGHRLYSRAQVQKLRFVALQTQRGVSAADAHRVLESRASPEPEIETAPRLPGPRVLILVATRDRYSAELVEFLLGTEGLDVELVLSIDEAKREFERTRPSLSLIEFLMDGGAGEELCHWLKERSFAPVVVLSSLDVADRALQAGADAFLLKPVGHLQLVSVVKDLLGLSAAVRGAEAAGP